MIERNGKFVTLTLFYNWDYDVLPKMQEIMEEQEPPVSHEFTDDEIEDCMGYLAEQISNEDNDWFPLDVLNIISLCCPEWLEKKGIIKAKEEQNAED